MSGSSNRSVAVVGAAAYIGGPLLRLLRAEGYRIVALVREGSDIGPLGDLPDVVHRGDLGDAVFVREATAGCSAIVDLVNQLNPPCASLVEQLENDVPPLDACLHAGLAHDARVIFTSGNFSIPTKGRSGALDETLAPKPTPSEHPEFVSRWSTFEHIDEMQGVMLLAETKHRIEHYVNDFVQVHPRSKACVLIPAATYGPGLGGRVSFWDAVPGWFLAGGFTDFMTGFIHVEDLAKGYLGVIERGRAGGRYLMAGEPMRVSDYVAAYAKAAGVEPSTKPAVFANTQGLRYDDSATRRELGVEWTRTLEATLPEHIAYLRAHGKLALG